MGLNIQEIIETLELNSEDLKGNRMLTNELIADDVMVGLGYNKKRDKTVQRLYTGEVDWTAVAESGDTIAVKVFAYDEDMENHADTQRSLSYCIDNKITVLLLLNGVQIIVMRYDESKSTYSKIANISLKEELNEDSLNVLNAVSKKTFDISLLDSLMLPTVKTSDIIEALSNNKDEIVKLLINKIGCKDITTQIAEVIDNLLEVEDEPKQESAVDNTVVEKLKSEVSDLLEANESKEEIIKDLTDKVETLNFELNALKSQPAQAVESDVSSEELQAKENEIADLQSKIDDLEKNSNNQLAEKDNIINQLSNKVKELEASVNSLNEQLKMSDGGSVDESTQAKIDKYVEKIRDQAVKLSEAEEARDKAYEEVKQIKAQLEEMSGSDLKKAEELLAVIEDNKEEDRNYVAVINSELMQYNEIHTFIGRCLQKLYELKSFDASQFIFNGNIFGLNMNAHYNDLIMNNKAYDVIISSNSEDEELNKLRIVFSHFSDVTFICKKIGTLRQPISARDGIEIQKEEVVMEQDEYLDDSHEFDDGHQENFGNMKQNFGEFDENQQEFGVDQQNFEANQQFGDMFNEQQNFNGDFSSGQQNFEEFEGSQQTFGEFADGQQEFDREQQNFGEFGENQQNFGEFSDGQQDFGEFSDSQQDFGGFNGEQQNFGEFGESQQDFTGEQQDFVPGFDVDGQDGFVGDQTQMEKRLLVGQLMNIDMLIWTEENVRFNNIKYISTNMITFGISTSSDSYDMLLCKCIDAILAIEAFNGSTGLINKLKQKDFSTANNFLKLYSREYEGYPRINGTKYAIVGVESIQQVASILLDICKLMEIDTNEIFLYFEAETNSQYIIDNYDFSEDAIKLVETNSYVLEDGVEPRISTAILKGDMFNHIVVTKNSLKVHKEIFKKALAIKTKYLAKVVETQDDFIEIIGNMLNEAQHNSIQINYSGIGNVIGESYRLVTTNPNEASGDAVRINIFNTDIYISPVEDWQVPHSLIKVHTALFNNTAIAVKCEVNADAIDFYSRQFETSEPSLGLAVNSFVDYVASCIKE